jgi:nicotinamidase-related amidase
MAHAGDRCHPSERYQTHRGSAVGYGLCAFYRSTKPDAAKGAWQNYYRRWSSVTLDAIDPAMLGLIAPLAAIAHERSIIDKQTYSIFGSEGFSERLQSASIDTLIFSGVETDVCVYASVLDAVDEGYRVILAADALASSNAQAHDVVLATLAPRLSEQIEILSTDAILKLWQA